MTLTRLGECCEIVSGATPKTTVADYWGGDIRWVTPADLGQLRGAFIEDTPRRLTAAGLASCSATVLPEGSVLLSSRAPIGHVAINSRPMATNQGFKSLVPKAGRVDAKYLYHWLRANKGRLQALGNGATFKELSKAAVERIEVPLPPLDQQRRIAEILDHADALRSRRERTVSLLKQLPLRLFDAAFGDPMLGPADARVPLGEVATVQIGPFGSLLHADDYVEGGVPIVNPTHIREGRIVADSKFSVRPEKSAALATYRLKAGDVILGRRGEMGRCAIVAFEQQGWLCGTGSLIVRPTRAVTSRFLQAALSHPSIKRALERSALGSTLPNLNRTIVSQLQLPVPSRELQEAFDTQVMDVDVLTSRAEAHAAELLALQQALSAAAFSGTL